MFPRPCLPPAALALTIQQQPAAVNIFNNHSGASNQQSVQSIEGVGFVSANIVRAAAKQTPTAGLTLRMT